MLLNLAQEAFDRAGWPTQVQTGRYMFELANNTRNTASVIPERLKCNIS